MTIKPVTGAQASMFPREIDAMFRNRAEVFGERLGWDVTVIDGRERDRFDDENPLYLIEVDQETGEYQASLRLLPTTGPNMLRDVFPQLMGGEAWIESANIWESSRICSVASADRSQAVLHELLLGIGEVCETAGLTQIVSVFDARMLRVLRTAGLKIDIIGTPQRIGGVMCYAALFDAGPHLKEAFKSRWGFEESALAWPAPTR